MMKFVLPIALLLFSLSDAADFVSPLLSPTMSPTPEPSKSDCVNVIYDMVDCLSFLTIGSTDSSPTKTCCVGIKSVLEYNPQCLCAGIESSEAMGFVLDNTRVFAMPSICNVAIDPHCDVASPAASTPVASPSAESPSTSPSSAKSPPASPSSAKSPSPVVTPSLPTITPSLPKVTKSPVATASSPAVTALSPAATASSPTMTAPSPSKSGSRNLSVSKLLLAAVIVSSFAYVLA